MTADASVLITGGLGFIGGHVTRALIDAGRQVTVLARKAQPTPKIGYLLRENAGRYATEVGSVEDLDQLVDIFGRVKPQVVVHSASNVEVASLFHDPYLAFRSNAGGTVNVLEAARRTGVESVVDMSSIGVLPPLQYQPIDTAHPIILPTQGPAAERTAPPRQRASCSRSPISAPSASTFASSSRPQSTASGCAGIPPTM